MIGLNWLDLLIILLLILGMFSGYAQGLMRQLITVAALYIGAVVASQYYYSLGNAMKGMLTTTPPMVVHTLAFFILLLAVVAIVSLLAIDTKRMMIQLHPVADHIGGMALGLITTWILLTIALDLLVVATGPGWPDGDNIRQIISTGIQGSAMSQQTHATMPTILAAIKPWLPSGLPSIFSFS